MYFGKSLPFSKLFLAAFPVGSVKQTICLPRFFFDTSTWQFLLQLFHLSVWVLNFSFWNNWNSTVSERSSFVETLEIVSETTAVAEAMSLCKLWRLQLRWYNQYAVGGSTPGGCPLPSKMLMTEKVKLPISAKDFIHPMTRSSRCVLLQC